MSNGRLALLMPTYRFDNTARECIRTLMAMGGGDVDVFIGDNSESPDKWRWLREIEAQSSNCHVFCHETNIGGANAPFLFGKVDHEYVALASDDDFFTADYYLAGLDILRSDPHCAAANGLHFSLTWRDDQLQPAMPSAYLDPSPVGRLKAYYYWGNSLCYSVYRSAYTKNMDRYFAARPYWTSYMDQFIAYNLLCQGTYRIDHRRQLFCYNNQHWGDAKASYPQDGRWFKGEGLPEQFCYINRICWTADLIHFFNSIYRPPSISGAESAAILENLYQKMFVAEFLQHLLPLHSADIGNLFKAAPNKIPVLSDLLRTPWYETETFLELFASMLEGFNPELAERYRAFVGASLIANQDPSSRPEEALQAKSAGSNHQPGTARRSLRIA